MSEESADILISHEVSSSKDYLNEDHSVSNVTTADGCHFQNTLKMWKQESFRSKGAYKDNNNLVKNIYESEKYDKDAPYEKAKNVNKIHEKSHESDDKKKSNSVFKKIDRADFEMVLKQTLSIKGPSDVYSLAKRIEPTERTERTENLSENICILDGNPDAEIKQKEDVLNLYKGNENSLSIDKDSTFIEDTLTENSTTKNVEYDNPWSDNFQTLGTSLKDTSKPKRVDDYENPWGNDFRFGKIQEEAEFASQRMVYQEIGELHQPCKEVSKQSSIKSASKSMKLQKLKDQIINSSTGVIEKLKRHKTKTKSQSSPSAAFFDKYSMNEEYNEHEEQQNKAPDDTAAENPHYVDDGRICSDLEEENSEIESYFSSISSDCEEGNNQALKNTSPDNVEVLPVSTIEGPPALQEYDDPWNDNFDKGHFSCEIVEASPECEEYEKIEINQSSSDKRMKQEHSSKSLKQRRASRIERVKDQIAETSALMVGRLRSVRKSVSLPITRLQAGGSCFAFAKRRHKSAEYCRKTELEKKEKSKTNDEKSGREDYEEFQFESNN